MYTAGMGGGMPQCAKVDNCTHTHATRFGITVGLPVPVPNTAGIDQCSNLENSWDITGKEIIFP